jgi:hypothetical protein
MTAWGGVYISALLAADSADLFTRVSMKYKAHSNVV